MARPTKYNEKMQKAADEYVNGGFELHGQVVPSVSGLACHLSINKTTIYEWAKNSPQFSNTLEFCKRRQEIITLNESLKGNFNSTISKLLLANHGYSEAQKIDHTSSDGTMTPSFDASKLSDAALAEILAAKNETQ
jgi:hypothetical protein